MVFTAGLVFFLLLLSAFFSGSETALTATSRSYMHQRENDGDVRAKRVNGLLSHRERLIATILLGNNLVNISASAIATSLMIETFGERGVVYATVIMTVLVLIFAEILPKTYALIHTHKMALAVAPIMQVLTWLFGPINVVIQGIVRVALTLLGASTERVLTAQQTLSELRGAIDLHTGEAEIKDEVKHERAMLRSVLDLADVEIGEIMTHRKGLVIIDADLPPEQILAEISDSPYTRVPLWRERTENIVGVLHTKPVLRALQASGGALDTIDILSVCAAPWFVPETTNLLDQLNAFRDRREHFAIVVDEYGDVQGVVTLEDILEEIVGDIVDETDVSVSGVKPERGGSYLVDGSVTIRDLNREFEWDLPDEEASTIAGLVMAESRTIPAPGQVFGFHGFRFEILRRQRNQIVQLRG
ncbi:MAG: HlyC/CorC family transporter, partial [Rhodospirillaceae bacterium]|nr:HlyC/CorC family transporter [Rhodospirillaceae bacterium]